MKRHPDLRDLSDDHHEALALARRCQRAGRPDPAIAPAALWHEVREAFADRIEHHFQIEDHHLLPALAAIGEMRLAGRIRDDHAALRGLVRNESAPPSGIAEFGSLLESHVRFEEREVFEVVQNRLPADSLRAIAAACRATRERHRNTL